MNVSQTSMTIGLVGVGPWGRNILRDLRSLGVTVHAVARSVASVANAKEGGAASVTDHPDDLPPCDGYVVAVRTVSHLDVIDRLLPRGRPIFCEKPLSDDLARIEALPAAAQDLVFTMHKWRYHPGVLEIARIARANELGQVIALRTFRAGWSDGHPDTTPFWILAPHEISIAREILGEVPQPVAAFSAAQSAKDGVIARYRTQEGVPFTFEVSARHPINLRRIILTCEDGVCTLDASDYGAILVQREGDAEPSRRPVSTAMPLLAELEAFVAHVAGGRAPKTALHEEIEMIRALTRTLELADAS